jgi:hypothetical protein
MKKYIVILLALLLPCGGCARSTFKPLTADFHAKQGSSIAVISGLEHDGNLLLCHYLSEELKNYSTYRVVSQKAIAQKVKGYPFDIQGPYKSAYFEIEMDFTKTDTVKLSRIQKQLGVDYLFVLWAPIAVSMNSNSNNTVHVVTQMYGFPGAQEVGRGRFFSYARAHSMGVRSVNDAEMDKGMKYAATKVAWELGLKTGMEKK